MEKEIQLKNFEGEKVFPITKSSIVSFNNNKNVEDVIYGNEEDIITDIGYFQVSNKNIINSFKLNGKTRKINNSIFSSGDNDGINIFIRNSNNKNIFYGENELGTIDGEDTVDYENCIKTKEFIKVKPSEMYSIYNSNKYVSEVFCYNRNKEFIKYIGSNNKITTPENCEFIKLRTNPKTQENDLSTKWHIELGDNFIQYIEPEYDSIKINEIIRSLPKDINDTIEYSNGKLYKLKRTEELTLNGDCFGGFIGNGGDNVLSIGLFLSLDENVSKDDFNYVLETDNFYCNNLTPFANKEDMNNKEGARFSYFASKNRPALHIHLSKDKVSETSESVKEWLNKNPITIIYELKNPIKIELSDIMINNKWDISDIIISSGDINIKSYFKFKNGIINDIELLKNNLGSISNSSINELNDKTSNIINDLNKINFELRLNNYVTSENMKCVFTDTFDNEDSVILIDGKLDDGKIHI